MRLALDSLVVLDAIERHGSFAAAAEADVIDADLAERLAPAAGLRNLLVHRYGDIRLDLVAAAIPEVLDGFAIYVEQVANSLPAQPSD